MSQCWYSTAVGLLPTGLRSLLIPEAELLPGVPGSGARRALEKLLRELSVITVLSARRCFMQWQQLCVLHEIQRTVAPSTEEPSPRVLHPSPTPIPTVPTHSLSPAAPPPRMVSCDTPQLARRSVYRRLIF